MEEASGSEAVNETAPSNSSTSPSGDGLPSMDITTLRRFIAPLSKEQLIELLADAALSHPQVYEKAQVAVRTSPASRRLMVRNIGFTTQDEDFMALFKEYGEIEDATIVRDKDHRSRGYGFVTYKNVDSIKHVLNATLTLDGRQLLSKLAADPFADFSPGRYGGGNSTQGSRRKLFIRNLSDTTDSEALRSVFSIHGELEDCAVVSDPVGRSRGYGFVTYSMPEAAIKAVQQPQRVINGRVAFVAFATPSKPKGYQIAGATFPPSARMDNQMAALAASAMAPANHSQLGYHHALAAASPSAPFYPHAMFTQPLMPGVPLGVPTFHPDYDLAQQRQQRGHRN